MKPAVICSLLLFSLAACKTDEPAINGYVEGEYVYIAPTSPGLLQTLSVRRGEKVEKGQDLFAIDQTNLHADINAAQAELSQAQARLDDLTKGKRPEEIEVIERQKEQANAQLENSRKEFERASKLVNSNAVSQSYLDKAKREYDMAKARFAELTAQLKVASLPARNDEMDAAKAAVDVARQKLLQAQKQLVDSAPKAPSSGQVEDTYFRPGEFVPAGRPVISLLPPENIKLRFFVSQRQLPSLTLGLPVTVTCDGCKAPIKATISYIATQAEYAPPVIYSNELREKLVFLVEAIPNHIEPELRPGLPVDIALTSHE